MSRIQAQPELILLILPSSFLHFSQFHSTSYSICEQINEIGAKLRVIRELQGLGFESILITCRKWQISCVMQLGHTL